MSKYACTGILPCIIYPSTAKAAQAELLANVEGTNASVVACAGLDATTRANWTTYYTTVKPFLLESPSIWGLGSRMDRIASYADDLYNWQEQLKTKSCALSVPVVNPTAIPPEQSAWMNLLQWGSYAVIAVAGAYTVGKVVEIWPHPSPAAAPAPQESRARVFGRKTGAAIGRTKGRARRSSN